MRLRWWLLGAGVLAALTFAWWVADLQHRADTAIAERDQARVEAAAATTRAETQGKVTEAAGALGARQRSIEEDVNRATETVRQALELDDDFAVEPVVRAWAAGVDGLREPAAASASEPVDRHPGERRFDVRTLREAGDAAVRFARRAEARGLAGRKLFARGDGVGLVRLRRPRTLDRTAV